MKYQRLADQHQSLDNYHKATNDNANYDRQKK